MYGALPHRGLREQGHDTPVLILSALSYDRVKGLRAGAMIISPNPTHFPNCWRGVEVLGRRKASAARAEDTTLTVGDLVLDRLQRKATRNGQILCCKPREFRLLEFLMRHAGQVVTRTMLLEGVWDYHFDPQTNVIDVHVSRLRAKIDKGAATPLQHTVRGAGYMIRDSAR